MSDEGEGFEFVSGTPAEIVAAMQQRAAHQHDMAYMEQDAYYHALERFMQEQTDDNLLFFSTIMRNLANSGEPQVALGQYSVSAARIWATRTNNCAICLKNHDEEAAKAFAAPTQTVSPESVKDVFGIDPHDQTRKLYEMTAEEWGCAISPDYPEDMRVQCMNCKSMYPNLADRQMKPNGIEGCSGCIQKAKWG